MTTLPLPALFARSLCAASKAFNLSTIDPQTQELIQSSLTDLRTLQSRISGLSLFSSNETLEDVSTRDLIYLLVPYVFAQVQDRVRTVERDERMGSLMQSHNHLEKFLLQLDNYDIIPEDEVALYDQERKAANPASRRELKIKQYQKEKDLRARIETIRKRRNQSVLNTANSTDFDIISSLLPSADLTTQLSNMDQELQLLRSAPPMMSYSPRPEDDTRRGKRKETTNTNEDNLWKIDAPSKVNGPILDSAGKPLRPFTILPSGIADRARFQAQVFGPGHNLPTMSVDEYLEIERQRGKFISGGGPASENAPTSSEQLALDAEMDGNADGEEKAEVKRLKDERWAIFTDENPRGAGNTMNRG
ncbi:TAP42-like protein [Gymnopus androsaceus JB14]|uniref:TAP42-like protein n=1 Tax=Gymnopus androsaceus JB14 TaxID=1447944 RepID=A0A6A4IID1_9AGAR|nr:TAP42-like protein [Gymnopus androsaceus JB14]